MYKKIIKLFKLHNFILKKKFLILYNKLIYIFSVNEPKFLKTRQKHPYFIPNPSIWPFLISVNLFNMIIILVSILYGFISKFLIFFFYISVLNLIASVIFWFIDLYRESTFLGNFTKKVQLNAKYGFWLFLASEVMFFLSFFWAFFHFSLSPSIWGGVVWPNEGIIHFISKEIHDSQFFNAYAFEFYNEPVKDKKMGKFIRKIFYYNILPIDCKFDKKKNLIPDLFINKDRSYVEYIRDFFVRSRRDLTKMDYMDFLNYKYQLNIWYFHKKWFFYPSYNNWLIIQKILFPKDTIEIVPVLKDIEIKNKYKYSVFLFVCFKPENDESFLYEVADVILHLNQMAGVVGYVDENVESEIRNKKEEYYYEQKTKKRELKSCSSIVIFYNFYNHGGLAHPFKVPLLNTALLITSGLTVSASHQAFKRSKKTRSLVWLFITIILSFIFMYMQFKEYLYSNISFNDGAYGSVFFLTTGFHGFHVIIGTLMLIVTFFKLYFGHFTKRKHLFFKCSIWYWHFVDAVWVLLFISFYWWGTSYYFKQWDIYNGKEMKSVVFNAHEDTVGWLMNNCYNVSLIKNEKLNFFDYNKNFLKKDVRHMYFMLYIFEPIFFEFVRYNEYYYLSTFKFIAYYFFVYPLFKILNLIGINTSPIFLILNLLRK